MSSAIELDDRLTAIDPVAGWQRWLGSDADRVRGLLISRPADVSVTEASGDSVRVTHRAALLRHPGLARVIEAGADDDGLRVIEEVGRGRPLADDLCRLPRGESLADELLGLLEALAYMHRQGLRHGAVSRVTVFSDGRRLLLTGAAIADGRAATSEDIRGWADLALDLLDGVRAGETGELVVEAARQAQIAIEAGRALDAGRVVRAIHRAQSKRGRAEAADTDEDTEEQTERSGPMKALFVVLHFVGSFILGICTTVLTIAAIGGIVALGVIWFLGQLPQEVRVPMVVGLERAQAEARIKQEGLDIGRVRMVYRDEIEPGVVAETVPPAGMLVREGRDITLVVSMGAARVKVPRIVGLRLDEAESVLEKQGLVLVNDGKVRSSSPEGEIVQQDPPPGRKVAQGQRVMAQVSGGPDFGIVEVPSEEEGGAPQRMVFRRIEIVVPRGDALQRVVVREGYDDDLETTYDRLLRPGDHVKLDTYGRPGKQIKVFIEGDEVFKTQL